MPAGITLVNDYGIVVIDETYPCLSLRAHATAVATQVDSSGFFPNLRYFRVTLNKADTPMLFLHIPNQNNTIGGIASIEVNGSSYTWTIAIGAVPGGGNNFGLEYWIYDRPIMESPHGVGFQVFDGSGRMTYNSDLTLLKLATLNPSGAQMVGQAGLKYAFIAYVTVDVIEEQRVEDDSYGYKVTTFSWRALMTGSRCGDGSTRFDQSIIGGGSGYAQGYPELISTGNAAVILHADVTQ